MIKRLDVRKSKSKDIDLKVTHTGKQGGFKTRFSFSAEAYALIGKTSNRIRLGADGDRVYFADNKHGYKVCAKNPRPYVIVTGIVAPTGTYDIVRDDSENLYYIDIRGH